MKVLACTAAIVGALTVSAQAQQQSLTVAIYGGAWGAALQRCVLDKFSAASGVQITPDPGSSLVTMTKIKQQAGKPVIDVAWMDGGISELAESNGLLAEIPANKIPDRDKLVADGIYKNAKGEIYALSTGFYSLGIVYNSSKVATPPTSWSDLWKPEYAGKTTVPSPNNANGLPFFLTMARVYGGSTDNIDAAVDRMKKLSVALYWDSAGAADNAFQSGEAIIGALHSANAWSMKDKGLPIEHVVPKEGLPAADIRVHVVKGTPKMQAALDLAAFATRKEVSECLAEALYVGPVRTDAELSAKAKERMPWGATGSAKNLIFTDWAKLNDRRAELTKIWNERVLNR
jgi:putative spermidine/putrescine transport system substrate-binding protein